MKYYRIIALPGLAGLVAEVSAEINDDSDAEWASVDTLIVPNIVVGDRNMRYPLPPQAVLVKKEYLQGVPDPSREYSLDSPYGKYMYEGRYKKEELEVAYTKFERALSISIYENRPGSQKTIYSQNFFGKRDQAMTLIDGVLQGTTEVDDLVFSLKELKERE